jgi:hypothetical protein
MDRVEVPLQGADAGAVIPRAMVPSAEEITRQQEGDVMDPQPDPDDPIWELGNDAVACGLPDASENHDRYLYAIDP